MRDCGKLHVPVRSEALARRFAQCCESRKDHLDKLIAAHAAALGVTVITNKVRDFARYPGVKTENWLIPAAPAQ